MTMNARDDRRGRFPKRLPPSEFSGAGTPPDPAREARRRGLAERAGLTGGYVDPVRADLREPDPATEAYLADWRVGQVSRVIDAAVNSID